MKMRTTLTLFILAVAGTLAACDEQAVSGPGFICDVTNPVRDLIVDRSFANITVHSPAIPEDTVQLQVVATNRLGEARSDVRINFKSSDETVATVDSLGIVHALKPGSTKITASACGESASTEILVVAQVDHVTIAPVVDTVVADDSAHFVARAFGQDGLPVPGIVFTFNAPAGVKVVRTSDSTANLVSDKAGSFPILAGGGGVIGNATLLVLPRVFLASSGVLSTLDVGDAISCGLISTGRGYCWGLSNHGQVGAATDSVCYHDPDPIAGKSDGGPLPCALIPVRVTDSVGYMTISAGDSTSCGITVDGRAYCWGRGLSGEIGNGTASDRATPALVSPTPWFTSISVGGSHVCALIITGVPYCWGNDEFGQLGDARRVHSTTPVPVSSGGQRFIRITAGFRHTCGIVADGTAYCWGDNTFGQLGVGSRGGFVDTPVLVSTGLKFSAISAGGDHTCGIATSGAAFCWGDNAVGQLGNGTSGDFSATPVAVVGEQVFTQISASTGTRLTTLLGLPVKEDRGHTCALTAAGTAWCWGDDKDLQLGRGQVTGSNGFSGTPAVVAQGERLPGVAFTTISTGTRHSCAVGSDGNAYCWGSNVYGALGNTLQAAFRGMPQRVATPQ